MQGREVASNVMQAHRKGGKLIEENLPDFGWKLESAGLIFGKETLEIY